MNKLTVISGIVLLCSLILGACANQEKKENALSKKIEAYMEGEHRSEKNIARNVYRHPLKTLKFLGIRDDMTVVEIWPSAGWYAELLAPALRDSGRYYAAGFATSAKRTPMWRKNMVERFQQKLEAHPDLYDQVIVTELSIPEQTEMAPLGSADAVLTFRNVHNWMKGGYAEGMFEAMYATLKHGGVLGVVEHRAKEGTSIENMIKSGYVTESEVIRLAEKAGFIFEARSEVNANPKDNADHPRGVWTLPPSLRLKEVDKDKYLAIGESDRMTLRFVKP